MEKESFAVISYGDGPPCVVRLVPGGEEGTTVYWGGGPGYMPCAIEGETYELLHTFSTVPRHQNGDVDFRALEVQMHKLFPPMPSPTAEQKEGWISPEGDVYTCRYGQHDTLANAIAGALWERWNGPAELEKRGWLRLDLHGNIFQGDYDKPLTKDQVNCLMSLSMVGSKEWQKALRQEIAAAKEMEF